MKATRGEMYRRMLMVRVVVSSLALLLVGGCAWFSRDLPQSAIEFTPSKPQEFLLKNGVRVLLEENNELPFVTGRIFIRGGELWESRSQVGVTTAMGAQMRAGGAGRRSADELDAYLTRLSATVDSSWGDEFGSVGFGCLAEDVEAVVSVFSDVLFAPRFEESRLTLWKEASLDAIARRRDEPNAIASTTFTQAVYRDSVYGVIPTSADVKKITRAQLRSRYQQLLDLSDAMVVISGAISRSQVERLLEKHLLSHRGFRRSFSLVPPPAPRELKPRVYFVEGNFTQSTVIIGELGVKRLPPDRFEIEMFNQIFGARGFGSRLMTEIRTKRGLAYGVYGAISPGVDRGTNSIQLQTKSASVAQALAQSVKILQGLKDEPPLQSEIDSTRRYIENSFVFKFASSEARVMRAATLRLFNYPADYDATYLPGMAAVTADKVQQVARRYWNIPQMVVVVVGDAEAYRVLKEGITSEPILRDTIGTTITRVTFDEVAHGL